MSTHNICFRGEIRKILCGYPLLSVAMTYVFQTSRPIFIRFLPSAIVFQDILSEAHLFFLDCFPLKVIYKMLSPVTIHKDMSNLVWVISIAPDMMFLLLFFQPKNMDIFLTSA